jgi:hypothetical protein
VNAILESANVSNANVIRVVNAHVKNAKTAIVKNVVATVNPAVIQKKVVIDTNQSFQYLTSTEVINFCRR